MTGSEEVAREGDEYAFHDDRGQGWMLSWHSPELPPPEGTRHGSGGICFTPDGSVVLVRQPDLDWEFPAGRPEGDEDWRATLVREVLEEACAVVRDATLLGYTRGACLSGPEEGLVLVRSLWVAGVVLKPWEPRHETTERRTVPPNAAAEHVRLGERHILRRWVREALASRGLA